MNFNRKRSKKLFLPEVSLTPLIDTALTLLIIFMITTPMLQDSIKVSLPETKNQKGGSMQQVEQVIITVDKGGKLFMNDKQVAILDLPNLVKEKIKQAKNDVVIVKGDRGVVYNDIVKVVDAVQGVEGVKHVALAAKRAT
jgi:biopolymer transport protein ExbD